MFKLEEFCVDNDGLEQTLMNLPYEVVITPSAAWYIWYDLDSHIGDVSYALYKAPAYKDGVGTTYATDALEITHRGAVIKY
jgi:hypothetical protein